jgi:pyruvate dehydrogenase E1 component
MARYLKYLEARGLAQTANRKVWVFCGDGEMDEPESLGAIGLASRDKLDNLIFVVNCNLQRLDGPVRGNGKIIQELEGDFRGAGWNVIKVIWGSYWDPLLARDKEGRLLRVMEESVDGEYQNYKANDGAFVRKHFFGKDPKVAEIGRAHERRGHLAPEPRRTRSAQVYAAYAAAVKHKGQPTVILAKTIKGFGLGKQGQAKNPTHQLKKIDTATIRRCAISSTSRPGRQARRAAVLHPAAGLAGDEVPARAPEGARRLPAAAPAQGGSRAGGAAALPPSTGAEGFWEGREISTTMAFVRR